MEFIKKPMLASKVEDYSLINFPVLATPKFDGIRCLKVDGKCVSRNFKPIPNKYIRDIIETYFPDNVDGELIIPGKSFNDISGAVRQEDGEPEFVYYIFDYVIDELKKPYVQRMQDLGKLDEIVNTSKMPSNSYQKVLPVQINTKKELLIFEEKCLSGGYEGVIIRDPNGPYKEGRSTLKEGYLLKIKRFLDQEAIIIGFVEKMHNQNKTYCDVFGNKKRSSHKMNLVPMPTLGKIIVSDLLTGVQFCIGTGFDEALRQNIWDNQDKFKGAIVKYKFQEYGMKHLPRCPVFLGFRDEYDI